MKFSCLFKSANLSINRLNCIKNFIKTYKDKILLKIYFIHETAEKCIIVQEYQKFVTLKEIFNTGVFIKIFM